jgi:hypothetical protein
MMHNLVQTQAQRCAVVGIAVKTEILRTPIWLCLLYRIVMVAGVMRRCSTFVGLDS